eukprot:CAMPEP_0194108066 /NCGR_PEP_ID=MMETSP0150-20130528/7828_1 /TAXON_ID=122233 /ORGANISM="Chaetoceros debilis, Strain MM31A-1" /LENGTH=198 /DNA_ID=CAMNT_0038796663 /DNA_START=200 /DNA_END=798 /DNA_ORIENTATION=-
MTKDYSKRKILVLHGDRQTGDLLVGRMLSITRKLLKPRNYVDGPLTDDMVLIQLQKISSPIILQLKIEFVVPDGPYVWKADPSVHRNAQPQSEEAQRENDLTCTWWERNGNECGGLEESLDMILATWNIIDNDSFEGILDFFTGGAPDPSHCDIDEASGGILFHGLKYVIMTSGYGGFPNPTNFPPSGEVWQNAGNKN